jgi:hypothetical protein
MMTMMGVAYRSAWGIFLAGLILFTSSGIASAQVDITTEEPAAPLLPPEEAAATIPTPPEHEALPPVETEDDDKPEDLSRPTPTRSVPADLISELYDLTDPYAIDPPPTTQEEFDEQFALRQAVAIERGTQALEQFADAPNSDDVRLLMLEAAMFLYDRDTAYRPDLLQLCEQVQIDAQTPDVVLLADTLDVMTRLDAPDANGEALIADYLDNYRDTPQEAEATLSAAILAERYGFDEMLARLTNTLASQFAHHSGVPRFLLSQGRTVQMIGQATTLDGETLTFPDSLAGRVAIIFFTDGPSPIGQQVDDYLQALYRRYRRDDLEIVSVLVNPPGNADALDRYVQRERIRWPVLYDNELFCPLAVEYQIDATPNIWILDAEGNILTDNAMDPSASTLTDALAPVETTVTDLLGDRPAAPAEPEENTQDTQADEALAPDTEAMPEPTPSTDDE